MAVVNLPFRLQLYVNAAQGGERLPIEWTDKLYKSWRRSVRLRGGYWLATAEWEGPEYEMIDAFTDSFQVGIKETVGGITTWEGFLAEMELQLDGMRFKRSWSEMANRVKVEYSSIGENLLTNSGVESAAWTSYNSPTTNAQSTEWSPEGSYSDHIVGNSANDGVTIQSSITISRKRMYQARVSVKIVSGTWRLEIYRTDTGEILGWGESEGAGQTVLWAYVSEDNKYAGNVGLRLYHTTSSGECYADAAVFQEGPQRAETSWYDEENSQEDYGTIEMIVSKAGMEDEAADALAQSELELRAWPRTIAPETIDLSKAEKAARLRLTFYGYVFTLNSLYNQVFGTDDASAQVSAILANAEFVSEGYVEANTLQYLLEEAMPATQWQALRDITLAGDADGDLWECGVYADKQFDYQQMSTDLKGIVSGGTLCDLQGAPIEPWLAEPGLYRIADMPVSVSGISGSYGDDPRVILIEEVEFDTADWLDGKSGLRLRRTE